jgi:hypothetical protein
MQEDVFSTPTWCKWRRRPVVVAARAVDSIFTGEQGV